MIDNLLIDVYNRYITPQEALDTVRYYLNEGDYSEFSKEELEELEEAIINYMNKENI